MYLGVANVTDPDGHPCESLVVMRRMPEDRRLSTLVTSGADVAPDLRRLARDLAAFHATARSGREIAEDLTSDRTDDEDPVLIARLTAASPWR